MAVAAFVVPLWWTTQVSENVKFVFKDEALIGAYELRKASGTGALCGVFVVHVPSVGCTTAD
jgi:hypothetical protein